MVQGVGEDALSVGRASCRYQMKSDRLKVLLCRIRDLCTFSCDRSYRREEARNKAVFFCLKDIEDIKSQNAGSRQSYTHFSSTSRETSLCAFPILMTIEPQLSSLSATKPHSCRPYKMTVLPLTSSLGKDACYSGIIAPRLKTTSVSHQRKV